MTVASNMAASSGLRSYFESKQIQDITVSTLMSKWHGIGKYKYIGEEGLPAPIASLTGA